MSHRILIVEDEADFARLVERRCQLAGYQTQVCVQGDQALALVLSGAYDLVILDLGLPGNDGILICQELRSLGDRTLVLMSTARREIADRVAGLRCGADDYLPKPYEMVELMARIEALLRRATPREPSPVVATGVLEFGNCRLDTLRQTLTTPTGGFRLQALEYRLLLVMAGHPDRLWSRTDLLDQVWGCEVTVSPRTVDVHLTGIRKMLHGSSVTIDTRRNQGYVLRVASA